MKKLEPLVNRFSLNNPHIIWLSREDCKSNFFTISRYKNYSFLYYQELTEIGQQIDNKGD